MGRRTIIRESTSVLGLSRTSTDELRRRALSLNRSTKKRAGRGLKSTTIAAYAGVFLLIITLVAIGYQPPQKQSENVANAVAPQSLTSTAAQPSVDQLVATNVAADIAARADLPIANNIASLSLSLSATDELAQTADSNTISKPQIVQPSADILSVRYYKVKPGDTVPKLVSEFGISSTTIKWANNLTSNTLKPGTTIKIPPVDGLIYTVKSGDTVVSVASKYKADEASLITFNDLDLNAKLKTGEQIIIPGGNLPSSERPGYVDSSVGDSAYTTGYSITPTQFSGSSAGNRYDFGNCTWYAYERRAQMGLPVGSFWGNASTWAVAAAQNGYSVNHTPSVGAVAQWNAFGGAGIGYAGHVGIVESVNSDGTITISEMNNYAYGGFDIVDHRTISPSSVSNFIH